MPRCSTTNRRVLSRVTAHDDERCHRMSASGKRTTFRKYTERRSARNVSRPASQPSPRHEPPVHNPNSLAGCASAAVPGIGDSESSTNSVVRITADHGFVGAAAWAVRRWQAVRLTAICAGNERDSHSITSREGSLMDMAMVRLRHVCGVNSRTRETYVEVEKFAERQEPGRLDVSANAESVQRRRRSGSCFRVLTRFSFRSASHALRMLAVAAMQVSSVFFRWASSRSDRTCSPLIRSASVLLVTRLIGCMNGATSEKDEHVGLGQTTSWYQVRN